MAHDPAAATPKSARSPLLAVFLTVFIDLLGFGIIIPLLPVYTKAYGASELVLGLLFGSFSAMQFVFAPMWGRVSDRIGRRPVLIGGLIGTACSYVLFAFATSLPALFASRILAGFFGANISTAQAYIADVTTPKNRAKGMGLVGAAFGLGFTFGPLLGGEFTSISQKAPGLLAAALSLTAATFGFFALVEPERRFARVTLTRVQQLRRALGDPRIGTLLLLLFLAIFAFASFEAMFTRFGLACFPKVFRVPQGLERATLEEVLRAAPVAGRYMFFIGILSALIQGGLIRRLVPRFGETRLAVAGPAFLSLSLLIVGVAPFLPIESSARWIVVICGCVVMPIGFGLNNPALSGLISRASPQDEQGAFLGISQSVQSFARMTGPPFAGFLFTSAGATSPFLIGSGILACATAIAVRYRRRHGATFEIAPGQEPAVS